MRELNYYSDGYYVDVSSLKFEHLINYHILSILVLKGIQHIHDKDDQVSIRSRTDLSNYEYITVAQASSKLKISYMSSTRTLSYCPIKCLCIAENASMLSRSAHHIYHSLSLISRHPK